MSAPERRIRIEIPQDIGVAERAVPASSAQVLDDIETQYTNAGVNSDDFAAFKGHTNLLEAVQNSQLHPEDKASQDRVKESLLAIGNRDTRSDTSDIDARENNSYGRKLAEVESNINKLAGSYTAEGVPSERLVANITSQFTRIRDKIILLQTPPYK
jgi:hypothetical protein